MHNELFQFFKYDHLPPLQQQIAVDYYDLAAKIIGTYPVNAERTTTLRKLLEARDAALRTFIYVEDLKDAR